MPGGLVGWLFADVALVLMIVFSGSKIIVPSTITTTTTTTTSTSSTTSTTSTLPPATTVPEGGVKLEAIETGAIAIGSEPGDGVASRLDERLTGLLEAGTISEVPDKVGVVLVYGGARTDGNVNKAKERACQVRDALLREWSRIDEGRVYFKCFHDLNIENGFVAFSLFPIIDD
jgi:hypothetical protein